MVGGVALGGYVVRLGLILVALVLLRHDSWIVLPWLGFTLVGAHLVLLFWETRYVSLSLAAPGLAPAPTSPDGRRMSLARRRCPARSATSRSGEAGRSASTRPRRSTSSRRSRRSWCSVLGTRRKDALVPAGLLQNTAESGVGFVRNQVIMQTIGAEGLGYLPYLTALFFFIFFSNITEIIPGVQFPANARFGVPLVLALMTWVIYNVVGVVKQGPLHYLKNSMIPPGVPKAILPLVMIIELVSTFVVRPFSLMVRLFANMLAGHLILVTFAVLMRSAVGAQGHGRHRSVLVRCCSWP